VTPATPMLVGNLAMLPNFTTNGCAQSYVLKTTFYLEMRGHYLVWTVYTNTYQFSMIFTNIFGK
jgi:hypothetical protein